MPRKQAPPKDIATLQHMQVEKVPIDSIRPNSYNANRQSDRDFELLCRSIEEDGFTQPVIVHRETKEIVDGEHRWRALKALGRTEVEIIYVDMTDAQRMIATLRHNRARGSENMALTAGLFKDLAEMTDGIDMAKDSLMLDDIDVRVMLDDIPDIGERLREEGDKLSLDDVNAILERERVRRNEAHEADVKTEAEEIKTLLTLVLKFTSSEIVLFNKTMSFFPGKNKPAKVLTLMDMYPDVGHDQLAKA